MKHRICLLATARERLTLGDGKPPKLDHKWFTMHFKLWFKCCYPPKKQTLRHRQYMNNFLWVPVELKRRSMYLPDSLI